MPKILRFTRERPHTAKRPVLPVSEGKASKSDAPGCGALSYMFSAPLRPLGDRNRMLRQA